MEAREDRFQITKEHDLNHIFEEERQLLEEMKKHPIADSFSDRFLLIFLICRKHNVERTVKTLEGYMALRKEHNLGLGNIRTQDMNEQMAAGGSQIYYKGRSDREGRLVVYKFMEHWHPKKYTLDQMVAYIFWFWNSVMTNEPLSVFRKGIILVNDMRGAGLGNIETSSKMKKFATSLMEHFPTRIHAVYVIHAGFVTKLMIGFAKLVFKKKMTKRIQIVHDTKLADFIDQPHLLKEYGGEVDWKTDLRWVPEGLTAILTK
jgi:hypothetical protein